MHSDSVQSVESSPPPQLKLTGTKPSHRTPRTPYESPIDRPRSDCRLTHSSLDTGIPDSTHIDHYTSEHDSCRVILARHHTQSTPNAQPINSHLFLAPHPSAHTITVLKPHHHHHQSCSTNHCHWPADQPIKQLQSAITTQSVPQCTTNVGPK
jgi:hypothetical protein